MKQIRAAWWMPHISHHAAGSTWWMNLERVKVHTLLPYLRPDGCPVPSVRSNVKGQGHRRSSPRNVISLHKNRLQRNDYSFNPMGKFCFCLSHLALYEIPSQVKLGWGGGQPGAGSEGPNGGISLPALGFKPAEIHIDTLPRKAGNIQRDE